MRATHRCAAAEGSAGEGGFLSTHNEGGRCLHTRSYTRSPRCLPCAPFPHLVRIAGAVPSGKLPGLNTTGLVCLELNPHGNAAAPPGLPGPPAVSRMRERAPQRQRWDGSSRRRAPVSSPRCPAARSRGAPRHQRSHRHRPPRRQKRLRRGGTRAPGRAASHSQPTERARESERWEEVTRDAQVEACMIVTTTRAVTAGLSGGRRAEQRDKQTA